MSPIKFLRKAIEPARTTRASDGSMSIVLRTTDEIMATRVPQACQVCNEHGMRYTGRPETGPWEECPDCPTIGTLLLWGVNVATAKHDDCTGYTTVQGRKVAASGTLLAALREVPT